MMDSAWHSGALSSRCDFFGACRMKGTKHASAIRVRHCRSSYYFFLFAFSAKSSGYSIRAQSGQIPWLKLASEWSRI